MLLAELVGKDVVETAGVVVGDAGDKNIPGIIAGNIDADITVAIVSIVIDMPACRRRVVAIGRGIARHG